MRYVYGTSAFSSLKMNECFLPRYSHAKIYPTEQTLTPYQHPLKICALRKQSV